MGRVSGESGTASLGGSAADAPAVPLALIVVQVLFASLAIAGRYVLPEFPAGPPRGEALTTRAALAGCAIFAGLATVMLAERRQHRQMPEEAPVGE